MNIAALVAIARSMEFDGPPTAVQGRIAGSKGVWMLDPVDQDASSPPRIWIRSSQVKINLGDQKLWKREHLIFDFLGPSRVTYPGRLSMQFIINMEHNGVPNEAFALLMEDGLREHTDPLMKWDGPEAPHLLRDALDKMGNVSGSKVQQLAGSSRRALGLGQKFGRENEQPLAGVEDGGDPAAEEAEIFCHERVMMMLQAGFTPKNAIYLRTELRELISREIEKWIKNYHIVIPHSAEAFIVPGTFSVILITHEGGC